MEEQERVFRCGSFEWNAKRMLYERVVVPTALYRAETWNLEVAKMRLYVMETTNA